MAGRIFVRNGYRFVGMFQDRNMPDRVAFGTKEEIEEVGRQFYRNAGVRGAVVTHPSGRKEVFGDDGTHLFTIPEVKR